ncbi:MAG: hypothetical protein U9Q83_02115 [Bacteroidota bacterium]|nr:hypothetical protein [Bacteroidota bacterium]
MKILQISFLITAIVGLIGAFFTLTSKAYIAGVILLSVFLFFVYGFIKISRKKRIIDKYKDSNNEELNDIISKNKNKEF